MRFILVNQALFNRGDESAHKALVYNLLRKFPDCSIEVLFVGRSADALKDFYIQDSRVTYTNLPASKRYRQAYIKIMRIGILPLWYLLSTVRNVIKRYKKADWVISSPGDASLGSRMDWDHLFFVKLAEYVGARVIYLGRSIGPFTEDGPLSKRFNNLSIKALRKADFISLRDGESERIADTLGLKYHSTLDMSFLHLPLVQIPTEIREQTGDRYAVIVPNYLIWHRQFRQRAIPRQIRYFFVELVNQTLEKFPDLRIVLMPQLFNGHTYVERDEEFLHDIAEDVSNPRVTVISETCSADILQTVIADAKFVIGARFHSIVFAIKYDVPYVALSFEHTVNGMLGKLGRQDRAVDISHAFDVVRKVPRLAEIPVGASTSDGLQFEAVVALARTMDKLDSLEHDPASQQKAHQMTAECFDKAADYMTKKLKTNKKERQ